MEFFDLTLKIRASLAKSAIQNGLLVVLTQHTTTAIVLNEKEEGLQKDMAIFLSQLVPGRKDYYHDRHPADGRLNTHSHLQSLLLPSSQVLAVVDGNIKLGSWQRLFFVELDGPRPERRVIVQVFGS